MATSSQHPITLDDAKAKFRQAADELSFRQVVRSHPYESIGLAFALGILMADDAMMTNLADNSDLLWSFGSAFFDT